MAQLRGLLISEKYVKENSEIDENVDMKLILPSIWYCQKQYIEKTLGTPLYNDLIAKVVAGTLAGDDLNLVDAYIADALLYWVRFKSLTPLMFKFRNKSIATNSSENSQPISKKDFDAIRDEYRLDAEYFTSRVTDYLCANQTLFPLYTTYTTSDQLRAREVKPTTGVFLGRRYPRHSGGRDMNNY